MSRPWFISQCTATSTPPSGNGQKLGTVWQKFQLFYPPPWPETYRSIYYDYCANCCKSIGVDKTFYPPLAHTLGPCKLQQDNRPFLCQIPRKSCEFPPIDTCSRSIVWLRRRIQTTSQTWSDPSQGTILWMVSCGRFPRPASPLMQSTNNVAPTAKTNVIPSILSLVPLWALHPITANRHDINAKITHSNCGVS